jgi:hypothetical protein
MNLAGVRRRSFLGHAAFGIGAILQRCLLELHSLAGPVEDLRRRCRGIKNPCSSQRPFFTLATIAFMEVMRILSLLEKVKRRCRLIITFKPGIVNFLLQIRPPAFTASSSLPWLNFGGLSGHAPLLLGCHGER